jgi:hypothetical protein
MQSKSLNSAQSLAPTTSAPQQQQQQQTTDALIINSNSNVVSEEILMQLKDQFGDNKQIYILNTSNNSVSTSSSLQNSTSANNAPIQYLIVDKDIDINTILQDPSIFSHTQPPQVQQTQPQQVQHQQSLSTILNNNIKGIVSGSSSTVGSSSSSSSTLADESIQRVQAPPPKRKKFEFKLENKRNSFQDAFLRFLAGEKQLTLDNIISEQSQQSNSNYSAAKKINSSSAASKLQNGQVAQSSSSSTTPPAQPATQTTTVQLSNGVLPAITNSLDKENYYNSSRRENLLPLNNYEYRNSYKDHYDNQGVRVNPDLIKNLTSPPKVNTSPHLSKSVQLNSSLKPASLDSVGSGEGVNPSKSSIVITKTNNGLKASQVQAKIINNDHTYKTHNQNGRVLSDAKLVKGSEELEVLSDDGKASKVDKLG